MYSSPCCLVFVNVLTCVQVWMELLSQAPHQYVVAASCPWMGAWLCLMMQASHIPIDLNMLLEVKARSKVCAFLLQQNVKLKIKKKT